MCASGGRQRPRRGETHVRGLGNRRQACRQRLFALVVVDLEVRRPMGEKSQGRVVGPRQDGTADDQHGGQRPAGRVHGAVVGEATRVTPRRNRKSAAGDNRTPVRSRRAMATLVLYQRLRYGTSRPISRCASRKQRPAPRVVVGHGGLVNQGIDRGVAEEAAIESTGRHLLGVEDAAQHVGIGHADPLQGEELKVAFQHIRIERRELVRPHVERHADAREVLLQHRRLQAIELGARDLQRQVQSGGRTGSVGIAIARLVEQRGGLDRVEAVVRHVRGERPRHRRQDAKSRARQPTAQMRDDGVAIHRVGQGLTNTHVLEHRVAQVDADVRVVGARPFNDL